MTLSPVYGWSNGGSNPQDPDYGTHDWIAQHALDWQSSVQGEHALNLTLNLTEFLYGTELPDNWNASDGIGDTVKHHFYFFRNGSVQNDASAQRAQQELDNAVNLFSAGNLSGAARTLGMVTHYISDVAVFGHVMGRETEWGAEDKDTVRSYEDYVEVRTDNYTTNYAIEFDSFLVFDGGLEYISAYDATKILANDTTFDSGREKTCVWMNQTYAPVRNWSDPIFENRYVESLNLATNLVADVLHTFSVRVSSRLAGDVNGDDRVDMKDVGYVARRFWCFPGNPLWDGGADVNADLRIDMKDISIVTRHFSEHS